MYWVLIYLNAKHTAEKHGCLVKNFQEATVVGLAEVVIRFLFPASILLVDTMSVSRVFTLLGDTNIRQHVNKNTIRANASLKSAQVLSCGNKEIFSETLSKVRVQSNVCIIACVSSFLSAADGSSTVSHRVDPVLHDFRASLDEACASFPDRFYLIAPPMYRSNPIWYREGLPEIMNLFSLVFRGERPKNLLLLPSFATPDFDSDGVNLTAYSGLEFILHLFDSSSEVLDSLELETEQVCSITSEATRVLEDRVMVLEQDHRRLAKVVDYKIAIDSEIADFQENVRLEICFEIAVLNPISPDLVGKAWQDQAHRDVQAVLQTLMGKTYEIIFISNATSRVRVDAEVTYSVRLASVADSSAIRRKFGSFYLGGVDKRPDELKKINIKNRVTPETKTRISVLKLLAKRYKTSNPGAKVQVVHYDPRPLLKITPAAGAESRRPQTYSYVEAVKAFPTNFTSGEVEPILKRINPKLLGQIRSIFICLSDDHYRKRFGNFQQAGKSGRSQTKNPAPAPAQAQAQAEEEEESEDGSDPPAPLAPVVSAPVTGRGGKFGKSLKRGASSDLSGSAAKK